MARIGTEEKSNILDSVCLFPLCCRLTMGDMLCTAVAVKRI